MHKIQGLSRVRGRVSVQVPQTRWRLGSPPSVKSRGVPGSVAATLPIITSDATMWDADAGHEWVGGG